MENIDFAPNDKKQDTEILFVNRTLDWRATVKYFDVSC